MRLGFAAFVAAHGLIHVLGAAKAFGWFPVPALAVAISRPAGALWLLCAVGLVVGAGALALDLDWWWKVTAPGLVLSQLLIVLSWRDARFGTIANLIAMVPAIIALLLHGPGSFHARYRSGIGHVLARSSVPARPITNDDLAHLPPPVQAYLRFAGVVGRPQVDNFALTFRGQLREGPATAWMPSRIEQVSGAHPASRWFLVSSTLRGVPFQALHVYEGAHPTFEVRVAGLKTVVDARGPEMDVSETVTLFNDICLLAPALLIDPAITWQSVDARTVRAVFTNAGHTIAADLQFNQDGSLATFVSDDRSRSTDGRTYVRHRWTTPITAYREFDGRRVAAEAEARWTLPEGEFTYARFELLTMAYNLPPSGYP